MEFESFPWPFPAKAVPTVKMSIETGLIDPTQIEVVGDEAEPMTFAPALSLVRLFYDGDNKASYNVSDADGLSAQMTTFMHS